MRDVYSWTTGAHAVKMGGELSYNKTTQDTLLNNYGVLTFNNSVTRNALADFLIGIPSAMTQDAPVTALWNSWYGAAFLQDDYRINGRMTLNLGLRWDVQTPGTDPQNRFTTYVAGQKSIVNTAAPAGLLFYGDPGIERGVIKTAWDHVSPRAGFAWDPFGEQDVDPRGRRHFLRQHLGQRVELDNFQPWSTRLTFTNISPTTNAAGVPNGASLRNPCNNFVGGAPFPITAHRDGGGLGASLLDDWAPHQTISACSASSRRRSRSAQLRRDVHPQSAVPARRQLSSRRPPRRRRARHPVAARSAFGAVCSSTRSVLGLQRPAGDLQPAPVAPASASTASTR